MICAFWKQLHVCAFKGQNLRVKFQFKAVCKITFVVVKCKNAFWLLKAQNLSTFAGGFYTYCICAHMYNTYCFENIFFLCDGHEDDKQCCRHYIKEKHLNVCRHATQHTMNSRNVRAHILSVQWLVGWRVWTRLKCPVADIIKHSLITFLCDLLDPTFHSPCECFMYVGRCVFVM